MEWQHSLREAVAGVQTRTKAAKLRVMIPQIEQRLAEGVRISDIVEALNANGLPITIATLKSYLYRHRKSQREQLPDSDQHRSSIPRSSTDGGPGTGELQLPVAVTGDSTTLTPVLLRHINTVRCLRMLRGGTTLSRAELARELGLTRATIGNAVKELIDSSLVAEAPGRLDDGRPGRPGAGIRLNPSGAYSIGIDVSSSSLTAVLLNLEMRVVRRITEPIESEPKAPEHLIEQIGRLPSRIAVTEGVDTTRIQGVCISIPGLVDHSGRVVVAPFLGWREVPLRQQLSSRTDLPWPVSICNDAVAFANAERTVADGNDAQNMLLLLLAEGLGGAIIQRGRILEGAHGYAGEIGHMVMGASPNAASTQTFELLAGYELFRPLLPRDRPLAEGLQWLAKHGRQTGEEFGRVCDTWAHTLATGILNLVYLLDPERIVLGGPLSVLFPHVETKVKHLLSDHLLHGFQLPPITVTRFGADGAAIGAASIVRDRLFALPRLERS
ncbi:ROK family transcriptional regulator [Burkholderia cenocepacia]|uniref:ROK family transcriptional regulator n=1 Tax=Burkholderia cenocepacia TaxID=95486 RepID=UPI0023B9E790|nr:ROK family transcriptional regulator [Burkholderia cenocepacia]MDF0504632.1 ROK family transcriptional regulator [Burkholderia cenocepacia]